MKKPLKFPTNLAASHPLFVMIPDLWKATSSTIRIRHFENNDHIFSHGDPADCLWLVNKGWIKLTRQTPDGKETIVDLCTSGDIIGDTSLFDNQKYSYTAEAIGADIELSTIPSSVIQALMSSNASLAIHISSVLDALLSETRLRLEHMNTMTAAQRLGCFLLRLCNTQSEGVTTLSIPIEKNILAAYLAIKPETLSRNFQQLKPLGITVTGSEISIDNIPALLRFVCNSCSKSGDCATQGTAD